jgi:hypothetical protein
MTIAFPPACGWTLAEALSRIPEGELRDRLASGDLVLWGLQRVGHAWELREPKAIQPDAIWAATVAKFSGDTVSGENLRLVKARVLPREAAQGRPTNEQQVTSSAAPRLQRPALPSRAQRLKGPAPRTLTAVQALTWVVYHEPKFPRNSTALAKRACAVAQEHSLPGADNLQPDSSMRDIASAMLAAIHAER